MSSQLGDTGVQRVVFRESDRITVAYTNLSNSYMIVDGERKRLLRLFRTVLEAKVLGSNHNVLAEVDANPYNGVLFGSDVARGGTQRIVAKNHITMMKMDKNWTKIQENLVCCPRKCIVILFIKNMVQATVFQTRINLLLTLNIRMPMVRQNC